MENWHGVLHCQREEAASITPGNGVLTLKHRRTSRSQSWNALKKLARFDERWKQYLNKNSTNICSKVSSARRRSVGSADKAPDTGGKLPAESGMPVVKIGDAELTD